MGAPALCIGTAKTARIDTNATASAARNTVARSRSVLAQTVTGARINSAKGFDRPPVRNKRKVNCVRSNNSANSASVSLIRLLAGYTATKIKLAMTATPTAMKHSPSGRSMS